MYVKWWMDMFIKVLNLGFIMKIKVDKILINSKILNLCFYLIKIVMLLSLKY